MGIRARPVTLPVTGTRTRSAHPEPAFSLQAVSEARRQPTDQRRLNPPLDASQARRAKIHLRAAVGSYQTKRGNLPTWSPGANRCRDAGTRISAVCASGRPLAPGRCLAGCPARPRVDLDLVIDKGLEAGETVVLEGQLRLQPGSKVQFRDQ